MKQIDNKKLCKYCLRLYEIGRRKLRWSNEVQKFYGRTSRLARKVEGGTKEQ